MQYIYSHTNALKCYKSISRLILKAFAQSYCNDMTNYKANSLLLRLGVKKPSTNLLYSKVQYDPTPEDVDFSQICQTGILEDNTDYIDCSARNLQSIPIFSESSACDILNLSSNKIRELPSGSFKNLRILKLYLENNPILNVHPDAFHGLKQPLEELSLSFDNRQSSSDRSSIPISISSHLKDLVVLTLFNLMLEKIPLELTSSFQRLTHLSLIDCNINNVSSLVQMSERLTYLDISKNRLHSLRLNFLSKLRKLIVDRNRISLLTLNSLPKSKHLQLFSCRSNILHEVDHQAFASLPLKVLLLSMNKLKANGLKFLNELAHVEELDLADNLLDRLPHHAFAAASSTLSELRLDGNQLVVIEGSYFYGLARLRKLTISRNNICYIMPNTFKSLKSLKILDLSHNPIKLTSTNVLNDVAHSLRHLYIASIGLQSIDSLKLDSLKKLDTLSLGENQMQILDFSKLCKLSNLKNIDLSGNRLNRLPPLPATCDLKEISFNSNPISEIKYLHTYRNVNVLKIDSIRCHCGLIDPHKLRLYKENQSNWELQCFDDDDLTLCSVNNTLNKRHYVRLLTDMEVIQENSSAMLVSWNVSAPNRVVNFTLNYKTKRRYYPRHSEDSVIAVSSRIPKDRNARNHWIFPDTVNSKPYNYYSICLQAWFTNPSQKDTFCRDVIASFASNDASQKLIDNDANLVDTKRRLLILGLVIFILFTISLIFVIMLMDDHRKHSKLQYYAQRMIEDGVAYPFRGSRSSVGDMPSHRISCSGNDGFKSGKSQHMYQEVCCHSYHHYQQQQAHNLLCSGLINDYRLTPQHCTRW
ncbi:hypothetical protein GJ496_002867 [Pomphorhynchus laevis]|nr:hypothetical protein GJ496_002867 [Pomphorhynchus laevis]